ncbi:MAG: hypothetical protein AAF081_01350 [Actinomycetota bacterium]
MSDSEAGKIRYIFSINTGDTAPMAAVAEEQVAEIRFVTTDVDQLNTPEGVQRLIDEFGLTALPTIDDAIGRPTNQKEAFGPASS